MDGLRGNFQFGQARDVSGNRLVTRSATSSRTSVSSASQPIGSQQELAQVLQQVTSSIQGGAEPPPFDSALIQAYRRHAERHGTSSQG